MTPNSDEAALVALSSLPGVGPNRLRAMLLSADPDGPLVAWRLVVDRHLQRLRPLLECVGVGPAQVAQWSAALRRLDAEALLAVHGDSGVQLTSGSQLSTVEPWSSDPEPPAVLFRLGRTVRAVPAVAIVGTRRCTGYGRRVAATIAADLAKAGVTVVSGVAKGIDGAAQRAALDAGGHVIGVVGTGLDVVYPQANRDLWHDLAARGTLLSEYPMGTAPARWRFPARNRLIAALADVVIVVESPLRGGSLYTVEAALERDRTVMAVPGPVWSSTSDGPNQLLVDGAPPVRNAADVLVALGLTPINSTESLGACSSTEHDGRVGAPGGLQWLLTELEGEAASIDELVLRTSRSLLEVTQALHGLQAVGLVTEAGGWWERSR